MASANSYKDPLYADLSAQMEQRFKLPAGLLRDIVVKGERSNADQVSEAGAKTVFQIIPATRKAALEKWGIDAYLSAENAAEVAARLLRDSLDRNGGDVREAVGEYHGGTDRKAWGPRTKAYQARVTGPQSSTFDRAKAERQADEAPSIVKVFEAYKAGKLTPEERKQFVADVNSGAVMLPRGASISEATASAQVLPQGVVDAYVNRSEMTDEERDQIDADIADGVVALPKGVQLRRPAASSLGERFGMGVRNVAEGAAGLVDLVAGPLNTTVNTFAGTQLSGTPTRDAISGVADAVGLPEALTPDEKLNAAIIEGGAQGVLTAGAGMAASGAKGGAGVIARGLADNPAVDIAASAAATGAMEAGRQKGADPLVQLGLGLAAGVPAGVATKGLTRAAERFGPKAAKVVETTPREVLVDADGALTEEGREVAARQGLNGEDLKGAYDEAAKPEPQTVWKNADQDHPVEIIGEAQTKDGRSFTPVKSKVDGSQGFVPTEELVAVADEAPARPVDAPAPVAEAAASPDAPLPATAQARVAEAQSEGVDLSRGQATKDRATQDAEQTLRHMHTTEGTQAEQFYAKQQEQLQGAVARFKEAFGDTSANASERGALVKEALREMRDAGKAGVKALYDQARATAESIGAEGSNLIALDTADLLKGLRELFIDEGVPETTRKALKQQAAKYGLIGDSPKTVEGETTVTLKDAEGQPAGKITFTGPQEPLTVINAEDMRKKVNALFEPGKANPQESLKSLLDDAVERAVERAATEGKGGVGEAFKAARGAFQEQKATFSAKDVVQKLIDWKKGTKTDEVLPENAIKTIFAGGPESLSNLKKVKAILLSKPTETSRAAWKAIQAHGVADVFEQALSPKGEISGARLNSAIKKFGADKLKTLLQPEDFNQLMKLRRIIGDATIPLDGTTNPSGSGYKVINFLAQQAQRLAPIANLTGVGQVANLVGGLVKQGKALADTKATLKGVTEFTPEAAANSDAPKASPVDFVRRFLKVAGSDELIQPVIAAAANEDAP
jgi:hypothetical protein